MSSSVVTARLDDASLSRLDDLCARTERSRAWVIAKAVKRFVDDELEYLAFLQQGIDELDQGKGISQEDMEAWFEARYRPVAAE